MQESMVSLMQMAKTSAALEKLKESKLPYISVMIDPIYGGFSQHSNAWRYKYS